MRNWLHRPLENYVVPILILLLYLALLAGPDGLGWAYLPAVSLLGIALAALTLRWLWRYADIRARLRVDAPAFLLIGLVVLALGLRLLRMPETRPAPGSDEAHFVESALGIIRTGKYIPLSLRHPTLLVYGELAVSVLRFVAGVSANLWTWPTELEPGHLYGWDRALVAMLGAATLVALYLLGTRRYGRRAGLLAALFLALMPMHLTASGIVTPEVPAALLVVLVAFFSLRLLEEEGPQWSLAAGACAGLAAATHYPAGWVLFVPLLAAWLRPLEARSVDAVPVPTGRTGRPELVARILLSALLAFVLACPALIFDLDRLVAGLAEATRAYFPTAGRAGTGLRYLLQEGLGYGPALLTLLGVAMLLLRQHRPPRLDQIRAEVVLYAFPLLIYWALLLPRTRFPRDMVLLAPWLALLAALGLDQICIWAGQRWPQNPLLKRWLPWILAMFGAGLFLLAG